MVARGACISRPLATKHGQNHQLNRRNVPPKCALNGPGVAVVRATKSSASKPVQFGLWLAWCTLTLSILFETFHPALFSEWVKYSAATALIVSHFYNLKFGRCHSDSCAIHQG